MSDVPSPEPGIASLGDGLTTLAQTLQSAAALRGSTLYFDYLGLTLFPGKDVAALTRCVQEMVDEGIAQSGLGHGALFLSVYAWPLSVDKARVTVQLAYTATSGTHDLRTFSAMFKEPGSGERCDIAGMPSISPDGLSVAFGEVADAAVACHLSSGQGAVVVLSLSLPHGGPAMEPAYLVELSTVSAWLIGDLSEEEALLAARLQRDGWLVRQFDDMDDALDFWASNQDGLEPALVIATEQADMSRQVLSDARRAWTSRCRVIYGVHTDHLSSSLPVPEPGIEIRKLPLSPADLREIKELGAALEADRNQASHSNRRDESRERPTALVVDDGPINRVLASEMLHLLGYDCDTAANGREAVEYVERYRPDVVLMDVDMPVMDGMEATERIRRYEMHDRHGSCSPVPIIATTARDEEDVSRSCEAIGMNGFVPKPLMLGQLAAALPSHAGPVRAT